VGGALIPQSPAKLSFAALLESPASICMNRSHAMRSIIVYSPKCVERLYEKWFSEGISLL